MNPITENFDVNLDMNDFDFDFDESMIESADSYQSLTSILGNSEIKEETDVAILSDEQSEEFCLEIAVALAEGLDDDDDDLIVDTSKMFYNV